MFAPVYLSLVVHLIAGQTAIGAAFTADPQQKKIAQAYALDTIDYAKATFGVTLDWTDASIQKVEKILEKLHLSYVDKSTPRPSEEQVDKHARAIGYYIGEVYLRNHGGEWGMVSIERARAPGLKTRGGVLVVPTVRAFKRIVDGPEENVADYYRSLISEGRSERKK